MNKVAVVYWSGTGNTEEMANAVLDGAKEKGADAVLIPASEFDSSMIDSFDVIAFGCPAMGVEELEDGEFAPMFESCESELNGKKIALFGSYGWGSGDWMKNWADICKAYGADLICDSVICNDSPDEEAISACKNLGASCA